MERAKVNGVELEYEVTGSGEPVLLISPVIAGGFLPFFGEPALVGRHRLIRYHKRGWGGSTHTAPPVAIEEHSSDAAALLEHLGVSRAHVAGHSSGAAVALQLGLDRPELVHTLVLLEPSLLTVPSAQALFEQAAGAFEAYAAGDHEKAVLGFLSLVSGFDPERCRAVIDQQVPDGVAQAIQDADTFFETELPALTSWDFGPEQARRIRQPVLSVRGSNTRELWVEVADRLRSWLPDVEDFGVEGVGHLLHIEHPRPVIRGVAAFLRRHPMTAETVSGELLSLLRE